MDLAEKLKRDLPKKVVDLRPKKKEPLINAQRQDWELLLDNPLTFYLNGKEYNIDTLKTRQWIEFSVIDWPKFVKTYEGVYNYLYVYQMDFKDPDNDWKISEALEMAVKNIFARKKYKSFLIDFAHICKKYFNIPRRVVLKKITINEILLLINAFKITQQDRVKKNALILARNSLDFQASGKCGNG